MNATAYMQKHASDFSSARANMIESQLRPNMIRDERILTAMENLPREIFVPGPMAGIAYIDEDLQVGQGRYLLEPMILARLLQEAKIKPTDRVLDIAIASGYSTAVIAHIAAAVVGVETDVALHKLATGNIQSLQIGNVELVNGPLEKGCASKAPYDVILINGSVDFVPDVLLNQLQDGGRLLAVLRHFGPAAVAHTGEGRIYEKLHGAISHRPLFDANVKHLPGFEASKSFVF